MNQETQKRLERIREIEQQIQVHTKAIQELEQEIELVLDPSKKKTRKVYGEKSMRFYVFDALTVYANGLTKEEIHEAVCTLAKFSVHRDTVNATVNKAVRDGIVERSQDGTTFRLKPIQASLPVEQPAPSTT